MAIMSASRWSPPCPSYSASPSLVKVLTARRTLLTDVQFFSTSIITNISMVIGPVAQFHENSKYYSAVKPKPNKAIDAHLPHVTIQMPVYKESLTETM